MSPLKTVSRLGFCAVLVAGWPSASYADRHYSQLQPVSAIGQGTTDLKSAGCAAAGLSCNAGDTCQCIEARGQLAGPSFQNTSVDLLLSVDVSHSFADGTGQVCFFTGGVALLSRSNGSSVKLETNGLACNSASMTTATYSGGYAVGAGASGDFAGGVGSGALNWSGTFATGASQVQIAGSL